MKRSEVLSFLEAAFASFIVLKALYDDLADIISENGHEQAFFNALITRLKYLAEFGTNVTLLFPKLFEHLKNANGIYSIRFINANFNIRILYAFLSDGSPILLHAFHERTGKQKTDYSNHIPIAEHRLKEYREDHNNG